MKLAYGIVGLAAAIAAVIVGILGMPDVMSVSLVLAIALLLAANSDRIARLKAGLSGIEAETRAIIDEARATIDQLRAVAKMAVRANLSLVMRGNRWGGFSYEEKETIRHSSIAALEDLRVPAADQEEIFREWHMVNRYDYAHHALGGPTIPIQVQGNKELHAEWRQLHHSGFERIPSPDDVEAFLRKAEMLDAEKKQLLEDYRYYAAHSKHRRPDVWRRLHDRDR
jgi:hypothetical protein